MWFEHGVPRRVEFEDWGVIWVGHEMFINSKPDTDPG
jgi:hypothetical protein